LGNNYHVNLIALEYLSDKAFLTAVATLLKLAQHDGIRRTTLFQLSSVTNNPQLRSCV